LVCRSIYRVEGKLKQVVELVLVQGWNVDLCVELAALGTESGFTWIPVGRTTVAERVSAVSSRMADGFL